VAIGASTGGPGAVRELLCGLPADFPLPVLVVIHLGAAFSTALADWLDRECPLRVAFAEDGQALPLRGGARVLLAPPDRHLALRDGKLRLTQDAPRHSCRPSVDTLFESLAEGLGPAVAACLLTGMGRDGAQGLLALRRAGAFTAAQDEASSVVFGMPREAVLLGGAAKVLPLDQFAPQLRSLAAGTRWGGRP
jgi:two-component system chemotaxis response regulator CheB